MEDFQSKYNGPQVEAILDSVANGEAGGGGTQGPQGPQGEQGPKGDDGVGIASVVQTTTSSADGGSNVMTVTLSDGTKSTFTVKNGSKGSQGEQGPKGDQGAEGPKGDKGDKGDTGATGANGTNGKDGADGEDGATFTPSVDANGNLSWTNNKGLSNPPTVNIKGPKGDSGEGGGSSGGKEYVEVVVNMDSIRFSEATSAFEPNKVYYATEAVAEAVDITLVIPPTGDVGEYTLYFTTSTGLFLGVLYLPSNWLWANGQKPTLEKGVSYELSVVATKFGSDYIYNAVLTPFKTVE